MTQAIKNNIEMIDTMTVQLVTIVMVLLAIVGVSYGFFVVNKAITTSRLMLLEKQSNTLLSDISDLEGRLVKKQAEVTMGVAKGLGFDEVAVEYIGKSSGIALSLNNEIR